MEIDVTEHWHLDKRVPLALIVTIFIQTVGIVWWAASISQRVDQIEKRQIERSAQSERLVRVEEAIRFVQENIVEIKTLLKQQR